MHLRFFVNLNTPKCVCLSTHYKNYISIDKYEHFYLALRDAAKSTTYRLEFIEIAHIKSSLIRQVSYTLRKCDLSEWRRVTKKNKEEDERKLNLMSVSLRELGVSSRASWEVLHIARIRSPNRFHTRARAPAPAPAYVFPFTQFFKPGFRQLRPIVKWFANSFLPRSPVTLIENSPDDTY